MEDAGPLSVLKTDSLRSILTLLVPGAIALLPLVCLLAQVQPAVLSVAAQHELLSALTLAVAALATGNGLNVLGSWWEAEVNDRILKCWKFKSLDGDWYVYLRMYFSKEPPGVAYLRRTVTTLKFELNTGMSLVVFDLGLWALQSYEQREGWGLYFFATAGLALVFLGNSFRTSLLLARLRRELAKGILLPTEANHQQP